MRKNNTLVSFNAKFAYKIVRVSRGKYAITELQRTSDYATYTVQSKMIVSGNENKAKTLAKSYLFDHGSKYESGYYWTVQFSHIFDNVEASHV